MHKRKRGADDGNAPASQQRQSPREPHPDPTIPMPVISNVVATFRCGRRLNLLQFAQCYGFEFQPSRFAACSIRLRCEKNVRSTALAFSSGKFVVTGARSELDSLLAARKYVALLNRLGERLCFISFTVQNIVSSCNFKKPIHLAELAAENTDTCSWENRKFPGLVLRDGSGLVVLVFRSGRCVITGAKSKRQLEHQWPRLYRFLLRYVDHDNPNKCSRVYAAELRRQQERLPDTAFDDPGDMF